MLLWLAPILAAVIAALLYQSQLLFPVTKVYDAKLYEDNIAKAVDVSFSKNVKDSQFDPELPTSARRRSRARFLEWIESIPDMHSQLLGIEMVSPSGVQSPRQSDDSEHSSPPPNANELAKGTVLRALKPFHTADVFLSFPGRAALTSTKLRQDWILAEHLTRAPNDVLISIYLMVMAANAQSCLHIESYSNESDLYEHCVQSASIAQGLSMDYSAYVDVLPVDIPSVYEFSAEAFTALNDGPLVRKAHHLEATYRNEFNQHVVKLFSLHLFTHIEHGLEWKLTWNRFSFSLYRWAAQIVSSRHFVFASATPNSDAADDNLVMLPFVDFMSHVSHINCGQDETTQFFFYNEYADVYDFHALEDIGESQELTLCYGQLSNMELLLRYGFVLENNRYDTLTLSASKETCIVSYQSSPASLQADCCSGDVDLQECTQQWLDVLAIKRVDPKPCVSSGCAVAMLYASEQQKLRNLAYSHFHSLLD